jgi:hypothetical protein
MEPVVPVTPEAAPVTVPVDAPVVAPAEAVDLAPSDAPAAASDEPVEQVGADAGVPAAVTVVAAHAPARTYPSLYDSTATTIVAVVLGLGIIVGIQAFVARMFSRARDEYAALTQFVVSMVALVVGAYLVDLVISGPDTSLLSASEKATILDFVKGTCGLVFGYYFGSRTRSTPPTPSE